MVFGVRKWTFSYWLAGACMWTLLGGAKNSISFSLPFLPTRFAIIRGGGQRQEEDCGRSSLTHHRWGKGSAASASTSSIIIDDDRMTTRESSSLTGDRSDSSTNTTATTSIANRTTRILADAPDFVKPERDTRDYRIIVLPNNLKVLLVSNSQKMMDGGSGVEAASVHVQSGHFDDTVPGLAHFHEHMLFLGTEKYPSEQDYEGFLSQYGGFSNAYTDMEDTSYFFSVTTEPDLKSNQTTAGLAGGLDRLAQFFIRPKFDPNATDRELRAIDSEYRNAITSDSWRNYQLLKSTCDQDHPFANFGCGNYETLTSKGLDSLLKELHNFWDTYYQSYNLRLAIVGHAPLDALQQTVEETFGQLPPSQGTPRHAKSLPNQVFPRENAVYRVPAYGPDQLGVIRKIIPFTESRSIKLYFATPPLDDPKVQDSKPYRVLSHLLGHESPGSLHSLLNSEGLLEGLTSGVTIDTSDFSLFSLTLSLTPKGMKQYQHVLDLVFQWIALIREHTGNKDLMSGYHHELRLISEMNFRFRENGDPADFCSAAAEILFSEDFDPSRILIHAVDVSDYDPEIANAFFDRLRPDNCMVHITSSDFAADAMDTEEGEKWQTEKWYGAKSQVEPITSEQIQAWEHPTHVDERLHLPALNAFIPTDFSLRCDDAKSSSNDEMTPAEAKTAEELKAPPTVLLDRPNLRLWFKMDQTWRIPKAYVKLSLQSSDIYRSPRSMTLNRIFQRVLNDDLNSFVYDASLAGCNYRVSCTPSGYRISVSGYSEKLPFLLDTLTTRILSLIEEMKDSSNVELQQKFQKAQAGLLRETKNYRLDTPYEVASYNSRLLIEQNVWYLDNYVDEMEGPEADCHPLTMGECAQVAEQCLMGRVRGEVLCMGNVDGQGANQVADVVDRHFLQPSRTLTEVEIQRFRSLQLPTKEEAMELFGTNAVNDRPFPLVYQELSFSESEENNAVEVVIQCGSELTLGYKGTAFLDLLAHIGYNSAYNQLRTKEQLGYIVSVFARRTAGSTWGLSIVVQGSAYNPQTLEKRCDAWLASFREELESMSPEDIAMEASAVAAQLSERDSKLSHEVARAWGEIISTSDLSDRMRTPVFGRLARLAEELTISSSSGDGKGKLSSAQELKDQLLEFFDRHCAASSPHRRVMSSRVFSQRTAKVDYEADSTKPGVLSTFADMRHLKQYLASWPTIPYWAVVDSTKK